MVIIRLRSAVVLAALIALLVPLAGKLVAQPLKITFPPVPCDSTVCDSVVLNNSSATPTQVTSITFLEGVSFSLDSSFKLPATINPSSRVSVPICCTPRRRGTISDSVTVLITTATGVDTLRIRLVGTGLGPVLDAVPGVLNFPKTNPTFTSDRTMVIRNTGERPFIMDASNLTIPTPFKLISQLPDTIAPGDSVTITVRFMPDSTGVYSVQVDVDANCSTTLRLGFNGVTDLIGTGAVLRVSKTGFNPANNEQIPCDSSRCTYMTFSNVGNAPLIIENIAWVLGTMGYTLTNPPPTPFIIAPQDSRDLQICITSRTRGMHRDTLEITSNTRSSIAFGMVIDVSGSMKQDMYCGATRSSRMAQAIIQANNFIGRALLYLPAIGIRDQLAITTYSTDQFGIRSIIRDIFALAFINNVSRVTAQNAVSALTPQAGTPTGEAVEHMVDVLAASPLSNRVIVLITDGEADTDDQRNFPINQVAARARARGIRVFTIGIGLDPNKGGRAYLQSLATTSGGVAYDATDNDCSTLQSAFEAITDILSRGAKTREPFQIKVLSPFLVSSSEVVFDSVYLGGNICHGLTITNAGEGDARLDSAEFSTLIGTPTNEFSLAPGIRFPIVIQEGGQVTLTVCFTPEQIRMRNGKVSFFYNNCDGQTTVSQLRGAAYSAANIRITDERIGLPGQLVTLPVYVDTSLTTYSVDSITYSVRWNKSMLDLRGVQPGNASGSSTVRVSKGVTFGPRYATVEFTSTGSRIPGGGELARMEFMVLRGDSLGSTVEVVAGNFADNNPRTRLDNAGMIAFDSTCFRSTRPVTPGLAAKISVGDATPTPANGTFVTLPINATDQTTIDVAVYAADGRMLRTIADRPLESGRNELVLDMAGAPSGAYSIVVRDNAGATYFRRILIAR